MEPFSGSGNIAPCDLGEDAERGEAGAQGWSRGRLCPGKEGRWGPGPAQAGRGAPS